MDFTTSLCVPEKNTQSLISTSDNFKKDLRPKSTQSRSLDKYNSLIDKKNKQLQKKYSYRSTLNQVYRQFLKCKSTTEFLKSLFKIEFLKHFNTIHLLIHEKGKAKANHLEVKPYSTRKSIKDVSDFNKLFLSIRKSKNRSFGQIGLKGLNFEILGTFIAREFNLPNHNIIFMISKDDFLPQTVSDVKTFNEIFTILPDLFDKILTYEFNTKKIKRIKTCLENGNKAFEIFFRHKKFYSSHGLFLNKKSTLYNYSDYQIKTCEFKTNSIENADIFHKERIHLLGDLLNTLRHELSNPLFGLKLSSDILLLDILDENSKLFVQQISISVKRCNTILSSFSSLYSNNNVYKEIYVFKLIEEVLTLTKSVTRSIRVEVVNKQTQAIKIFSNDTWIVQILFNLIINSAQELIISKCIDPIIKIMVSKKSNYLNIKVIDNGTKLSKSQVNAIFNAFYTTKNQGTGLGLYISRDLAKKLSGDLNYISNNQHNGSIFELSLPIINEY